MENLLTFKGSVFNGSLDLKTSEFVCVPSKPHYSVVDLCLRANVNKGPNIGVADIDNNCLSFEEKKKLGYEIQKRWNTHNKLIEFAKYVINGTFAGGTYDADDIQTLGVKLGLLELIEYDPEIHAKCEQGSEKGDPWYLPSELIK